jgi:hypothetical protein
MVKLALSSEGRPLEASIEQLVIAGWTGRDSAAVEHHIAELEAIGVARPKNVPSFYRVSADRLTTSVRVQVAGQDSSGEVEVVLLSLAQGLFVGIGSDHTDRKVEAYGVTVSKQMCPKPIGPEVWPMAALQSHWDQLVTRSWVTAGGQRRLYQEGPVSRMRRPEDLIERYTGGTQLPAGTAMFCGTHAVMGEIAGGELFEIELHDPVSGRSLRHQYAAESLPIVD